jgi:hypothetical protein
VAALAALPAAGRRAGPVVRRAGRPPFAVRVPGAPALPPAARPPGPPPGAAGGPHRRPAGDDQQTLDDHDEDDADSSGPGPGGDGSGERAPAAPAEPGTGRLPRHPRGERVPLERLPRRRRGRPLPHQRRRPPGAPGRSPAGRSPRSCGTFFAAHPLRARRPGT